MSTTSLEQRFGVAAAIGLSGALVASAITQAGPMFRGDFEFIRCAGAGAFVAGTVLAGGFGKPGPLGWVLAAATFLGATLLGAMIAVSLMPVATFLEEFNLPELALSVVSGSAIGALFVVEMLTSKAAVLWPWIGSILAVHLLALTLRDRRTGR